MKLKILNTLVVVFAVTALFAKSYFVAGGSSGKTGGLRDFTYGDITREPEDTLTFSIDNPPDSIDDMAILTEYLPDGITVEWTGRKFKLPKAGKVKYSKKDEDFVTTSDENPCGLKLSISNRGKVSGSFTIYVAKSETKLKSYKAKVSGRLGEELKVTVKGQGTFSASLE